MISFIQVIDVLRTFAQGHLQLHKFDFEFREQMPNLATVDEAYPMLYIVPVGTSNIQFGKEFELDIYCVDRYKKDRSNVGYVISDTELILSDLSVYLENQTGFDSSYGSTTPINNDLLDYVGGHVMRIRVTVEKQALCELPFDSDAPVPPTCPSALVRNSDGTWSEIVPSGATYILPDTPVTVVDTEGNPLGGGTVVSITGGVVEVDAVPECEDATYLVEYENGTPIESGSIPSGGNKTIQVPNPIVCADGTVNINGTLFDTVASGGTLNIQVRKSTGNDLIGSKQGQYWRIPNSVITLRNTANNVLSTTSVRATESANITAPDTALEINSVPTANFPAGSTIEVNLTDGVNPVTPDDVTVVGNVVTVEVPAGGGSCPIGAKPLKTGQTTSYVSNDDGDTQRGRLVDFFTLNGNNAFGNTNRFTDLTGGQTYAANGVFLDHATDDGNEILAWTSAPTVNSGWSDAISLITAQVTDGKTGWFMPNRSELEMLINDGVVRNFDWSPLNVVSVIAAANNNFWTCTTPLSNTLRAKAFFNSNAINGNEFRTIGKTLGTRSFACRYYTYAELGL